MIDAITVVIESLKKGRLRERLLTLREELRVDPFAVALFCELEPARAEDLIGLLLEELSGR